MRMSGAPALALLAVAVAAPACTGAGPTKLGAQPSWRRSDAQAQFAAQQPGQPFRFAPASLPAALYNHPTPVAPPSSPIGDAVVAAVRAAAAQSGLPAPVVDGRLFAAASELAAVVPEQGVVAYALVEFAMQHHGIVEPSPHLLVVWGPIDDPATIVEQFAPRIPELLGHGGNPRVGVGASRRTARGDGVVILAVQGSSVVTRPIPRAVPNGGRVAIEGNVLAPYRDPEIFVTHEDGKVSQPPSLVRPGGKPGAFRAELDCAGRIGRQQVEVTAIDAGGSTVLANFPVWCNQAAPREVTVSRPAGDDIVVRTEAEAERGLVELLNRDREAQGLLPLQPDAQLAEVARNHSREMKATGVVAHVSPTTGSAADRVRAAGIRSAAILENVARAYGVGEAHAGLMNSPGHRANILSPIATHVGIAVVFGDEVSGQREMFVTQVFTRVPPKIDAVRAAAEVRAKLRTVRPVKDDPTLDTVAQRLAADLARGVDAQAAKTAATKALQPRAGAYRRIGTVITAVSDLSAVTGAALLGDDASISHVGIGVVQGDHPEIGQGALWIVLLIGEQR
jgi:uncharacterized protein YkwD